MEYSNRESALATDGSGKILNNVGGASTEQHPEFITVTVKEEPTSSFSDELGAGYEIDVDNVYCETQIKTENNFHEDEDGIVEHYASDSSEEELILPFVAVPKCNVDENLMKLADDSRKLCKTEDVSSTNDKPRKTSEGRPTSKPLTFLCQHCNKLFSTKASLLVHMRTHTLERPFPCKYCEKTFSQKHSLKVHTRTHTGEAPFHCRHCGKSFVQNSDLVKHVRVHTGETPFPCGQCGKSFSLRHHLRAHERMHSGEKPFSCGECGKSFPHKYYLAIHNRTHTGEVPFLCKLCPRAFSRKHHLEEHERMHSGEKPFLCQDCGKSFVSRTHLALHRRIHTGETPFSCTYCGKTFSQSCNLKRHWRTHKSESIFRCGTCDKIFYRRVNLVQHEKIHASGNPAECVLTNSTGCDNVCGYRGESLVLHSDSSIVPVLSTADPTEEKMAPQNFATHGTVDSDATDMSVDNIPPCKSLAENILPSDTLHPTEGKILRSSVESSIFPKDFSTERTVDKECSVDEYWALKWGGDYDPLGTPLIATPSV